MCSQHVNRLQCGNFKIISAIQILREINFSTFVKGTSCMNGEVKKFGMKY